MADSSSCGDGTLEQDQSFGDPLLKSRAPRLRAFDYVEDQDGWIYVVRAVVPSNHNQVLAKPIYPPSCLQIRKLEANQPISHLGRRHRATQTHSFFNLAALSTSSIRAIHPRAEVPIADLSTAPAIVMRLAEVVESMGARVFLYGSRRVHREIASSDWDVLVDTTNSQYSPMALIVNTQQVLRASVRRFSPKEIRLRARRYSSKSGALNRETLTSIFLKGTPYLKSGSLEIGVFFACEGDTYPQRHAFPQTTHLSESVARLLVGAPCTPMPTGGHSFYMPRRIRLRFEDYGEVEFPSIQWELGGLEEAHGTTFRFQAATGYQGTSLTFAKLALERGALVV